MTESELVRLLNQAEVALASIRHDERPAVPENPQETIGQIVQRAEAAVEEAKRLLKDDAI